MSRLQQSNIDRALEARVDHLRRRAERLEAKAALGLSQAGDAEQQRQIKEAWAEHADALRKLEQSRTVYVVEPAQKSPAASELRQARARVYGQLGDLSRTSTEQAVLELHDMRSRGLEGLSPDVRDVIESELWDQAHDRLVNDPNAHWHETQWTQGSDELRAIYEATQSNRDQAQAIQERLQRDQEAARRPEDVGRHYRHDRERDR